MGQMNWQDQLNGDSLSWLLEPENPTARYLALRDLLDRPADDPELLAARDAAFHSGPIAETLAAMQPEGYWAEPGPGYNPKYRSTVWSLIALAQLGASVEADERVDRACAYLLDHGLTTLGQFTMTGTPSGTIDCLQGNLCDALTLLGCDDPRLEQAFDWMARSITGEGIAPMSDKSAEVRYYAGNRGPLFACGANEGQACAWGGVKEMLALSRLPEDRRAPQIREAIRLGAGYLLDHDPAAANYPYPSYANKTSGNWWKFGFPVFYITDLLQNVEALVRLGYGDDPRLAQALEIIRGKQDAQGRWSLEYDYNGKTWVDFGTKKQPNKYVTLRALRVLKGMSQ